MDEYQSLVRQCKNEDTRDIKKCAWKNIDKEEKTSNKHWKKRIRQENQECWQINNESLRREQRMNEEKSHAKHGQECKSTFLIYEEQKTRNLWLDLLKWVKRTKITPRKCARH